MASFLDEFSEDRRFRVPWDKKPSTREQGIGEEGINLLSEPYWDSGQNDFASDLPLGIDVVYDWDSRS